eukprot:6186590-Pleurochrysis_carterae.AAC.2
MRQGAEWPRAQGGGDGGGSTDDGFWRWRSEGGRKVKRRGWRDVKKFQCPAAKLVSASQRDFVNAIP